MKRKSRPYQAITAAAGSASFESTPQSKDTILQHILIVDDDDRWRRKIALVLRSHFPGVRFLGARNANAAYRHALSGKNILFITMDGDLGERSHDGAYAVMILRQPINNIRCPIIMISGDRDYIKEGKRAGAKGGLLKNSWETPSTFPARLVAELRRLKLLK